MNKTAILLVIVGTTLAIVTGATAVIVPYVHAAQSCNQPGGVVNACVNANVAKNNICVGVLAHSTRCTVG
jgi:hypothetical protein